MNDEIALRYIAAHVRMHGGNPNGMTESELLDCFAILPTPGKSIDEFAQVVDPKSAQKSAVDGLRGLDGVTVG